MKKEENGWFEAMALAFHRMEPEKYPLINESSPSKNPWTIFTTTSKIKEKTNHLIVIYLLINIYSIQRLLEENYLLKYLMILLKTLKNLETWLLLVDN